MNDLVEQQKKEIASFTEQGLTEAEAKMVVSWIDRGRPGISKLKAEELFAFYLIGQSCQDINKHQPEYPLEMLLWARIHYKWDKAREEYKARLANGVIDMAVQAKLESIRFMVNLITATHVKWGDEINKYIANPTREKAPSCLPQSLHQYGQVLAALEEMTAPPGAKKGAKDAAPATPGLPSVAIQINQSEKGTVEVKSTSDVRDFMVGEFKKKNEQPKDS